MPKAAALPTIPQAQIPQFGVIVGGLLDGWSYGGAGLEVTGRQVRLLVNATPPGWPFPDEVRLDPRRDFTELRPGPGAALHDSRALIQRVLDAKKFLWDQ
jgi:hypothetical protein